MKTFIPKAADIDRKWYVVDADGMVLGRLASQVANILRGKNKPIYTPNMDTGDYVIIINASKAVLLPAQRFSTSLYFILPHPSASLRDRWENLHRSPGGWAQCNS